MNKVKPYLFWIICGIILLVEIVVVLVISPTGKGDKSAEDVKKELDADNKKLTLLFDRASQGSPSGEFDAENKDHIAQLTTKWLPAPSWKSVLEQHVQKYRVQTGTIQGYLSHRSEFLHRTISSERDPHAWYTQYQTVTADLLQKLYDDQCLVMPVITGAGAAAATAEQGDAPDFAKKRELRQIAGFVTTTNYPEPGEWPKLTVRFHVMEMIADALHRSKSTNEVSTAVPLKTPFEAHAQLVGITWKEDSEDIVGYQLTLQGPISSILSAEAALEENIDDGKPISVVSGATLGRKTFAAGERRDITSEPVVLKLTAGVLDYSNLNAVGNANGNANGTGGNAGAQGPQPQAQQQTLPQGAPPAPRPPPAGPPANRQAEALGEP